jgi:pimeloyl-ACP methyl ester carboxylesterase
MQKMTSTTFVLIPGAGLNPAIWQWTIAELRSLGHIGIAPALPLDDPDARPSDHAAAVCEAVAELHGPTVVVGQSLGAFAAALVAAQVPAVALVLVAPMIPAPGESAGEWWGATRHAEAIAPLVARYGQMGAWDLDAIREVFLHDVPEDVAQASAAFSGAPGPGMFAEPWPLTAWPTVPTRVLAPREDRLFPLSFQRRVTRERLGLEVDEMPGGHVPMLARPRALAQRLMRASAQA